MPSNKRQHFVPRFYLKFFSIHSDSKAIGVFNIPSGKFIPNGDLRNQAYRNYFYGKSDGLDECLTVIEAGASPIIKQIIEQNSLPGASSPEFQILLLFVMLLSARTEYEAERINDGVDQLFRRVYQHDPEVKDTIEGIGIALENPMSLSLGIAARGLVIVSDLRCKLLLNRTKTTFWTSDNPVVFYNQFLETRRPYRVNTGWALRGLQIILPLSPIHSLLYFDENVYKVGSRRSNLVCISRLSDVQSLNRIQYINANSNLLFNETITEHYLRQFYEHSNRYRRKAKVTTEEYQSTTNPHSSLFAQSKAEVRCRLNLSFIKIREKALNFDTRNEAYPIRSKEIVEYFNKSVGFEDLSQQPNYPSSETFIKKNQTSDNNLTHN